MRNTFLAAVGLATLLFTSLGCNMMQKMAAADLFEGDNAAKAAQEIKAKVGSERVEVIRVNVEKDEMEVTIQSPTNPKDIDKYTYKNGSVSGPEPVQVIQMGNLAMTGEKYQTTEIGEINFAAIPETVARAIELSKLENAEVTSISMNNQSAETADPSLKEDREKLAEEMKKKIDARQAECRNNIEKLGECLREVAEMRREQIDLRSGRGSRRTLVLTWRLFVQSPRGRKDFWADKNGKLNETAF